MSRRYRTALVGTSWWGAGAHLPGLQSRPDVEVVALAGRDPARLAEVAGRYQIPATFTDFDRLLAEARPEVAVIAAPNHLHAPLTLAALQAGAHVICEKPLALDAPQAAQMLARAEALGRRHLAFLTYRGMPGPRYLKTLIAAGYLGRLHHVQAQYLHGSWLDPRRPASWKTRLGEGGSGVLGDLGAHLFDLLQWWLGPVTRAAGSLGTFIAERPDAEGRPAPVETDDAAAGVLEFTGGGQATFQLSRVAAGRRNYQRIELYGSEGVLVYEYDQPWAHVARLWGARLTAGGEGGAGGPDLEPITLPPALAAGFEGPESFPAVYRALTDPFFASLADEAAPPPAPSFADGLAAQRVIDAVGRSALTGRWEAV
jgi:predicted dehydrogenase